MAGDAAATRHADAAFARWFGLLPDVAAALFCLVVWIAPLAPGAGATATVVLMMAVEFIAVQAVGVFALIALGGPRNRVLRLASIAALLLFCLAFVITLGTQTGTWWPVLLFCWLVGTKAAWVIVTPPDPAALLGQQLKAWGFAMATYFTAVIGGLLLPLPPLGLDPATVARLGLTMGGEWSERPHIAAAGLAFHLLASAAFRFRLARPAPAPRSAMRPPPSPRRRPKRARKR